MTRNLLLSIPGKSLLLLAFILLSACMDQKSSSVNERSEESLVAEDTLSFTTGSYYFGRMEPSPLMAGKYNVELIKMEIDSLDRVKAQFYYQPYGSDGMRGSFTGRVDREAFQLRCKRLYYTEGERYKEAIAFPLLKEAIGLGYTKTGEVDGSLPLLEAQTYNSFYKTFLEQQLEARINTSDRSRLAKLEFLEANAFTSEAIDKLQFMEVMLDLNADPSTMEYLIYIMDPMLCGSGGCNLFIVNEAGETLSKVTVTRPPIYMPVLTIAEQQARKGQWQDLYVYSDGMRRLRYKDGRYTANASMGLGVDGSMLSAAPESYQLVMDYPDTP